MPQPDDAHIGARIAAHRKMAGYTQHGLSAHAHLSLGCVRKVERGERLPTAGVLTAVARALRTTVEDLSGQPYRREPRDDRVHAPITAVRAALRHWDLPGDWFQLPRPLPVLKAELRMASTYRLAGRLTQLGTGLAGLLEELTAAVHLRENAAERRQAARLLALAYDLTHTLAYRLGYPDLRGQVEDRLRWAAGLAGDPLLVALADYKRVEAFKSAHEYDAGLRAMAVARERLSEAAPAADDAAFVTVLGGMRLREVTIAARMYDAEATAHHLEEAGALLGRLPTGEDRRHHTLVFGSGNLAIHEIQARLELQHMSEAERLIRTTRLPGTLPPTRVSAWHINAARVHLAAGKRERALRELQHARRASPQITRYKPMARDTALLLMMKYRRTTEEVRSLNTWFGLEPSA
ncbi:helix-turn-helix domain-containing protein [Streptomyces sp. NBC_01775]|uniref:helix-turn-helix domain-containing protein n=1 Tax=Streptomyces sp. NBC_01775 TaxID=2975939 RepID=UPI002DD92E18|nr:helix-turn-helix transcriptional regulator [Streptomyces sp. NBC_01775]WSB77548.1 helix-turn-helix domain-containing protein [Streptomyces sp. NBC_01775]